MSKADNSVFTNWSVIVHSSLASSHIGQQLRQKGIKVRGADSVLEGSVIFPKSKVAFLVLQATKQLVSGISNSAVAGLSPRDKELQAFTEIEANAPATRSEAHKDESKLPLVLDRLDKFCRIHGQGYIVLQAPLFTEKELAFLYQLQDRYLDKTSVDIITAHSLEDCVSAMLAVSSLQAPPKSDVLHQRYCQLMTELVQPLPREALNKIPTSIRH